jgi:hypothetical protein
VVSFTPRPLYLQGKSLWYPLDLRLGGSQSRSGHGPFMKYLSRRTQLLIRVTKRSVEGHLEVVGGVVLVDPESIPTVGILLLAELPSPPWSLPLLLLELLRSYRYDR